MYWWYLKLLAPVRHWWLLRTRPKHRSMQSKAREVLQRVLRIEHPGAQLNYLKKINPYVFEELILLLFSQAGCVVWHSPSYSGDGGVDGRVFHPQWGWCLIQSKCYHDHIHKKHVLDFLDLCQKSNCLGFFVHSGKTSTPLRSMIHSSKVQFLSGSTLLAALKTPKTLLKKHTL